jgi:hypothetical protein
MMKLAFACSVSRVLRAGTLVVFLNLLCQHVVGAEYLVSDRATNRILRFDASDGALLGPLVDDNLATNGGLFAPAAMAIAYDNDLFVTSISLDTGEGQLLRYAVDSGAFEGVFAGGLVNPAGLLFHEPSNTMLVGSLGMGLGDTNVIARVGADGSLLPEIALGPVSGRTGMAIGPDGAVYVSSFAEGPFFSGSVLRYEYDSSSDSFSLAGTFAAAPELAGANGLVFDAQGDLYVAGLFGQTVLRFDVEGGTVASSSVVAQAAYPSGVAIAPDGDLLVTSLGNDNPSDPIYQGMVFPGSVWKVNLSTGVATPFLAAGEEFQPTAILLVGEPSLPGDFNDDGTLDAADIDLLTLAVGGSTDARFDVNADGAIDQADRVFWVNELKRTYFGDANLDGEFSSSDLVETFAAGQYRDNVVGNSTWATGDWDGDQEFDTSDLITAFQAGAYEQGPRAAVQSVPEPSALVLLLLTMPYLFRRRRSR